MPSVGRPRAAKPAETRATRAELVDTPETVATKVALYRDAYEEGKRSVAAQFAQLDNMRTRALSFMAFIGASTGFLVGAGLNNVEKTDRTIWYTISALAATVMLLLSILAIIALLLGVTISRKPLGPTRAGIRIALWGRKDSPSDLVRIISQRNPVTPEWEYYRTRALSYERKLQVNSNYLRRMRRWYMCALTFGSLALVGWATIVWAFA